MSLFYMSGIEEIKTLVWMVHIRMKNFWDDILESFQNNLVLKNLADSTISNYVREVKKFLKTINKEAPENLISNDFKSYILSKPSSETALKHFHGCLREEGFITEIFLFSLPRNYRSRSVDIDDYEVIAFQLENIKNPEAKVLIALLISSLRIDEACHTRACNISPGWETIKVEKAGAKNENERTVVVIPEILHILTDYIQKHELKPHDLLLHNKGKKISYNKAKNLFDEGMAELSQKLASKYTPHHLRHLVLTSRSINLELSKLKNEAGHSYVSETVCYISMDPNRLRKKMDLHPYLNFSQERRNKLDA